MPVRLFNLRNVPEDEANEIRELLTAHGIDFYETHASGWGISAPAFWLSDDGQQARAEGLIEDYQKKRTEGARATYAQLRSEGRAPTWAGNIARHPLRFLLLAAFVLFILYASLSPFVHCHDRHACEEDSSGSSNSSPFSLRFEWSAAMSMYTAGTTNSVNMVPMAMPLAITRPIL